MQEFAQKNSAPPGGQCPSAEDLAAYIDGELGEAEKQRITEHLASCEDCYAVYTETLHFQLDTNPVVLKNEKKVVRFPSREEQGKGNPAALRRWLPIAALLLVGVGGGRAFQFLMPPPGLTAANITPPLPDPSKVDQPLWRGPTYRGEGGDEESKFDEAAFRMGVQLVNLQASLQAGNVSAAQDVVARILGLLKAQPFTDDLQKGYTGITLALTKYLENHKVTGEGLPEAVRLAKESHENQRAANSVLPEASRLAKESREVFEPTTPLDLGQWVEAGRLAALSRNPSFFQQSDTQSFLRRLRWREKLGMGDAKLDPVSRESLDQISEIASKGNLQASDYAKLKEQFDKILDKYYPDT
jgi:hypothetical protein